MKALPIIVIVVGAALAIGGCAFDGKPRLRMGCYPTSSPGTVFLDEKNLGKHHYAGPLHEKNGIVYTCRGGDIDTAHVRIAADYVRYLYYKSQKTILRSDTQFTFKANEEPTRYFVRLKYPKNWDRLSRADKRRIADEVALELSQYLSYTMVTWHEILTWFGYKSTGFFSEFPSAFSWEDNYSNIVGARLGAEAVEDDGHDYDEAMTILLKKELENLGVQPRGVAEEASDKMLDKWWEMTPFVVFVVMRERNMDLGYEDGFITPTLIPGVCEDAKPQSYPVPTLATLNGYGFRAIIEIELKEFEKGKIFRAMYPDVSNRIRPDICTPLIMDYIKKQAVSMGYNIMPPKK